MARAGPVRSGTRARRRTRRGVVARAAARGSRVSGSGSLFISTAKTLERVRPRYLSRWMTVLSSGLGTGCPLTVRIHVYRPVSRTHQVPVEPGNCAIESKKPVLQSQRGITLHTREVAGSKPAAPITRMARKTAISSLPRGIARESWSALTLGGYCAGDVAGERGSRARDLSRLEPGRSRLSRAATRCESARSSLTRIRRR
jgi:hypothetical protein